MVEIMRKARKKHINLYFKDGDVWKNKFCTAFYQSEDDGEENMLEFGNTVIYESEIESIEILE